MASTQRYTPRTSRPPGVGAGLQRSDCGQSSWHRERAPGVSGASWGRYWGDSAASRNDLTGRSAWSDVSRGPGYGHTRSRPIPRTMQRPVPTCHTEAWCRDRTWLSTSSHLKIHPASPPRNSPRAREEPPHLPIGSVRRGDFPWVDADCSAKRMFSKPQVDFDVWSSARCRTTSHGAGGRRRRCRGGSGEWS